MTLKKPTLKNRTLKKWTHTRTTPSLRTISPTREAYSENEALRPGSLSKADWRTDRSVQIATAAIAAAVHAETKNRSAGGGWGERLPFTDAVLDEVRLLGVNLEELADRFFVYQAKNVSQGKRIADPSAYFLKMARDEAAKSVGVSAEDLKGIASPNEWKRGDAFARAMGTPPIHTRRSAPQLPSERLRQRLAKQLERAGFCPRQTEEGWQKKCIERTTRLDFDRYASLLLTTAPNPIGIRMASTLRLPEDSPAVFQAEKLS